MSKFQDSQGPLQKFQDFPGLESKFSNSRTFQVFKDLCEPCLWYQVEFVIIIGGFGVTFTNITHLSHII